MSIEAIENDTDGSDTINCAGHWALRHLNLTGFRDEVLCLLGHNGAGKSTTLSLLVGLMAPTEGRVEIRPGSQDDSALTNNSPSTQSLQRKVHRSLLVGVCPQHDIR